MGYSKVLSFADTITGIVSIKIVNANYLIFSRCVFVFLARCCAYRLDHAALIETLSHQSFATFQRRQKGVAKYRDEEAEDGRGKKMNRDFFIVSQFCILGR